MRGLLDLVTDGVGWQRFRHGLTLPASLSAVRARWERASSLGADPDVPVERIVPAAELRERAERVAPLLHAAPDVLDAAAAAFAERDFTLLLADADGVVMRALAGGGFAEEADRVKLVAGSEWSEPVRGTNAIGTALVEARPVAVRGAAHWARPNHALACWAAPLRDPLGRVLGVLDATSFHTRDAADPVIPVTLMATARAIEAVLRLHGGVSASHDLLTRVLEAHPGPALLVERAGRIRAVNARAAAALPSSDPTAALGLDWAALSAGLGRRKPLEAGPWAGARASIEPGETWNGELVSALVLIEAGPAPTARPPAGRAPADPFAAIHGEDPRLQEALRVAARLARSPLPMLLLAETGTGKELLARAIHAASPRADRPLVVVNCGALSESLLESELFGHAPNAFTGASPKGRDGHLAAADGGTLFLDEIAEMTPRLQATLLRFLEDGTYQRLGDPRPRRADVRLVSATCRDLTDRVRTGAFRQDLFFRIRGAVLSLPPLRDRTDLPSLADHLLVRLVDGAPPRLSAEALARLQAHDWPGNVRELRMALMHAVAMADGAAVLEAEHLPAELASGVTAPAVAPLADQEVEAVRRALATHGSKAAAASALGIARSTLYRMIERYGL